MRLFDHGKVEGSEATRLSVMGHGGFWSFGAGLCFTHTPWALNEQVVGFEVRANGLARWRAYIGTGLVVRFGDKG